MIVPMKKVTLIALQNDRESALTVLRDLGVMQIELDDKNSADSMTASGKWHRMQQVAATLEQLAAENELPEAEKMSSAGADALADEVEFIQERRNTLSSLIIDLRRRSEALAVWGDFDRSLLDKLNADGVCVRLCAGSSEEFRQASALEGVQCREISRSRGKVAFAAISLSEIDETSLPVVKLDQDDDPRKLSAELKKAEKELDKCAGKLLELAAKRSCIAAAADELAGEWEFCRVRDSIAEHGEIVTLSGFVPEPEMEKISAAARKNGWGVFSKDPSDDEEVPVLLKNNRFTKVIKPLFDFLGIVPGYREIDISGAVLIFFTIFYAIIIGDAGYGILFGIISLLGLRASKKVPKLRPPMRLLLILSIAATVWGALCGSWFGLSRIGSWEIPALDCIKDFSGEKAKQANLQFFCFILAVVQLSVGRIWRAINERKWRSVIQHLGWMLIIWGNFFLTIRLIVYPGEFPVYMYVLYGAGLLMVTTCGVNWKQMSDVFQFPFDIIGSFTDVLSYIRLFAVGLAGACIAGSFNGMAFDLCDVSAWLIPVGIIVALVGHALNIVLALLSVLVHAVRLNTLEFSNHTGLSWSGQNFNPFKSHSKED